jgi:hypothetical protein
MKRVDEQGDRMRFRVKNSPKIAEMLAQPGTDVMIFLIFSPKNSAKKWRF